MELLGVDPVVQARDSSKLLGDPAALRGELDRSGFVLLRAVVPIGVVTALREDLAGVLEAAGWATADPVTGSLTSRLVPGPRSGGSPVEQRALYRRLFARRSLHELAHLRALRSLAEALLGSEDLLLHPRPAVRVVLPSGDGSAAQGRSGGHSSVEPTPPHQDHVNMQGTPSALTFWLPLVDCSAEVGPLCLAEGSHRLGALPAAPAAGGRFLVCSDEGLSKQWRSAATVPGDLVVFAACTVHRALVNRSGSVRLSVDFRYQRASEPVCETTLRDDPDLPWEELYASWEPGGPRWHWRRPDLVTVPFDPGFAGRAGAADAPAHRPLPGPFGDA
ncbi:MAG: hypothetical protein JWM85_3319 [Acidimicrobiaceae bacterium]|nr:hypothetical protein [Acidimicrobiaceae bacterium]